MVQKIGDIPLHKVVRTTTDDMGLYRGYATSIVIDAPFEDFFKKEGFALQFDEETPLYLKFDTATQTVIDGKLHLVLIRERFEPVGLVNPMSEEKPMTVKEIKDFLEDKPDDLPIYCNSFVVKSISLSHRDQPDKPEEIWIQLMI